MRCEVCSSKEFIAGVGSCTKGAISFCYCQLCLAMNADPKWICDFIVDSCNGIKNVHEGCPLIYYDNFTDTYKDLRTGAIPISFNNYSFLTKTDAVREIKRINKEHKK